jgi:glycosyltransferase involved in cell wall biosynthesis
MKKLSIIIPHYNSVSKLLKLIESIPFSDYASEEFEMIVVDDKSNENLDELIHKISNYNNIILLFNESENKGAGVCRNIGINKSNSEWIIFADADDFFSPDVIKNVSQFYYSSKDIIYFKVSSLDLTTNRISDRHIYPNFLVDSFLDKKSKKNELLLRYNWVVPWGRMIKSSLIKENSIEFDSTIVSNDIMFSTKVGYAASSIEVSDKEIYYVTKSKGSLTTTFNTDNYYIRSMKKIESFKFLKDHLSRDEVKQIDNYAFNFLYIGWKEYNMSFLQIFRLLMDYKKETYPIFPSINKIVSIIKKRIIT